MPESKSPRTSDNEWPGWLAVAAITRASKDPTPTNIDLAKAALVYEGRIYGLDGDDD